MKKFYVLQIIDLRVQVNPIDAKNNHSFEKFRPNPAPDWISAELIKHREEEMISDGKKLPKVQLYELILSFQDFLKNNNLNGDVMNEGELKIFHNFPIFPKDSEISTN